MRLRIAEHGQRDRPKGGSGEFTTMNLNVIFHPRSGVSRLLSSGLIIGLCLVTTVAQSVTITPQRSVYRRSKPMLDSKRTFTIRRPIVKASTPILSRKITTAISPEKVLALNTREELTDYQWLEEANYKVLFNQNGVLCVEQWMTGAGAYPDSVTKTVVVDIRKGERVTIRDVFSGLPRLAAMIRSAQTAEIKAAAEDMKSNPDTRPEDLFRETNFTIKDLNEFAIDAKGVTFIYDYGFPHVIEALQPTGRFHFTWKQLKPHIRTDGLLARFVR